MIHNISANLMANDFDIYIYIHIYIYLYISMTYDIIHHKIIHYHSHHCNYMLNFDHLPVRERIVKSNNFAIVNRISFA